MSEIRAVIFGATGVIGKGVLWESLEHPAVKSVVAVGRRSCGVTHPKLTEILHDNFDDLSPIADKLKGSNACFYCLGVSSAGMSEERYSRITYDYTVAAAKVMAKAADEVTFCFISGMGTGKGRSMWSRVKHKAENALKEFGFRQVYLFRPGGVQPVKNVKTDRLMYKLFMPLIPLLKLLLPGFMTTTENVGRAMLQVTLHGNDSSVLENKDINRVAALLK